MLAPRLPGAMLAPRLPGAMLAPRLPGARIAPRQRSAQPARGEACGSPDSHHPFGNAIAAANPHPAPAPRGSARAGSRGRHDQPRMAARTRPMKPSIAAGSVQRSTATMPLDGSTQVKFPPAPEAKKASRAAEGNRAPSLFSHHRKP